MRIERVRIEGFGQFESFELALSPKLNVVFGPNESGKSTLLAFIRMVLFGFDRRADLKQYEPARGPLGGELWLKTRTGPMVVRRLGARKAGGDLSIHSPQGEARSPAQLSDALCGISRDLFCEVFAFGLAELASFDRLASEGNVSQALFAVGIQGGHRYPEVSDGLKQVTDELFSGKGGKRELNLVLAELAEVQEALRAVGDRPAAYLSVLARKDAVEGELSGLEGTLEQSVADRDKLARLKAALGELAGLAAAEAELAQLPPLRDFPPDAQARLEERLAAQARARAEVERLTAEAAEAAERAEKTRPSAEIAAIEPELAAGLEGWSARQPLARALASKRASLIAKKRQLGKSLESLGLGLDADALVDVELGAAAKNRLATVRDEIADAQRVQRERDEAYRTARAARERAEADIRRVTGEQQRLPQVTAASVRRALAALGRIPLLQSEAARLTDEAKETRRAHLDAPESTPTRMFPASILLGALVGLSAVAALAGGVFGARAGIPAGAACALVAALLIWLQRRASRAYAAALKGFEGRIAARQTEDIRLARQARELSSRAEDKKKALEDAAEEAHLPANAPELALQARAEALQTELAQIERREALSRELEAISSVLASTVSAEKSAQADRDVARSRISKLERVLEVLTSERRFPEGLNAERALDLWSHAADVQQRLLDLRVEADGVAADDRALAEAADALNAAARKAGLAGGTGELAAAQAKAFLTEQARIRESHRSALERKGLLDASVPRAREQVEQAEGALNRLYAETACADESSLRRAAAQAARFEKAGRDAREHRVKAEATSLCTVEQARAEVSRRDGPAGVSDSLATAEARVAELSRRKTELLDERGQVREKLLTWENDVQVAELREREESLAARAGRLARRYAVARTAGVLLSRARERYQEAHQPQVLKLASRNLSELTGGKYVRVQAATSGRELLVRDVSGHERAAEELSRGTREQLYLAFRLAVVEGFGQTLTPLPIVLDDILVNFDLERTRNTLEVLARLSEVHQVIAFTCHPGLKDAFVGQGARLSELGPRQQALLRLHAG